MNAGERLLHILEGTGITTQEFFASAYKIVYPSGVYDVSKDVLRFQVAGITPDYVAQVVRDMQTY